VKGSFQVGAFEWSPDSRHIVFDHVPPDWDWKKSDISEVEVASGKIRVVANTPASETSPSYSPDGRYLAFVRSSEPPRWARSERIVLLSRGGGELRVLPATYDEWVTLVGWTGDSSRILYTEGKGVSRVLAAMPVDGQPATVYQPARGFVAAAWIGASGAMVGFTQQSSDSPPEGYVLRLAGGAPVRVSRANDDLPKPPLGETRVIRWKAQDWLEIEGLLTLPVGYESGKKCPLVVVTHGGPAGAFLDVFLGSAANPNVYPYAAFAAKGYASLRPNIRGSSGYGKKFRWANLGDWGGKDYEDMMAGADHIIALGIADPNRLAVMGSSYGGYMTTWAVGHTKRFKAAISFAGVTNLWSFTGTTDIPDFMPDWFGGEPWENFETYRAHSPMSYVNAVTTPTLILHGEIDIRAPISQSFEFYNALKRRGVPVQMVIYPRTGHWVPAPKLHIEIMQRHLDWLEKYLR
jgi:dipeptidyl aminopeptidase/acylaminoacyl peptidase